MLPAPQRPHVLWVGAAVLALISIGARWGSSLDPTYYPGWYSPGYCTTVYDYEGWASLDCTSGYTSFGMYGYDVEAVPGYAGPARVLIVLAVAAIAYGYRSARTATRAPRPHSVRWLRIGLAAAAAAPLLTGLRLNQGQLCWWLALALVALALRAEGRLPFRLRSLHFRT